MQISKKTTLVLVLLFVVVAIGFGSRWVGTRSGTVRGSASQPRDSGEFENRLFDSFSQKLDAADDLSSEDRDEATRILRDADPLLSRIRSENREAIRRANTPPQIVPPIRRSASRADEVLAPDAD